jgi:hypothetical protein
MAYVEVEVDLSDFDTKELLEELELRGTENPGFAYGELVRKIYEKRRLNQDYQKELDELIYFAIGKIL